HRAKALAQRRQHYGGDDHEHEPAVTNAVARCLPMTNTPDIAERAALARYVHQYEYIDGVLNASTFRAALRYARQLGGRNVDTGVVESAITASWPSSLMYL